LTSAGWSHYTFTVNSRVHTQGASQDRAYEFIKERVLSCHFKPGQRVNALELASKLKISRTPIREALGRLEQEGFVRREDHGGYTVRTMSLKEVIDLYQVRQPLEVQAALDALPFVDESAVAELSAILSEAADLLAKGNVRAFLLANRKFHLLLARLTGNTLLYQMLSAISDRIRLICEMIIHRHSPRATEILEENLAILEAVKQREPTAVEGAVRSHIHRAREHATSFFSQQPHYLYVGEQRRR